MNDKFISLMQDVLDEIKTSMPYDDMKAYHLNDVLRALTEAHQKYIDSTH